MNSTSLFSFNLVDTFTDIKCSSSFIFILSTFLFLYSLLYCFLFLVLFISTSRYDGKHLFLINNANQELKDTSDSKLKSS